MATTTPNYGWDVPTSTDYVKDGATAIETLGDDIDATLYTINNGSAKVGLHLLNTTTFTGVTSVSVDNVFNSTYENYIIKLNCNTTNAGLIALRLRDAGGDSTGTNYQYTSQQIVPPWSNLDNSTAANIWNIGYNSSGVPTGATVNLYGPNIAARTSYDFASSYNQLALFGGGTQSASTQWTGFKILNSSGGGNIAGTVRVYGLRNS